MGKFTTKERRDMTRSGGLVTDKVVEEAMNAQFDLAYAGEVKKDQTNNEVFRRINSQLTGLAFEHRYISGRYRPALDEHEIQYVDMDNERVNYVNKTYWDSEKLQIAANLEVGNDFHLNIREGTTVSYPIRPSKYASWVDDTNDDVLDFETTEVKLIQMIRDLENGIAGTITTKVSGEYSEKKIDLINDLQNYMTVGFEAYQGDPESGYMTEGYDKTGELILITENFESFDYDNFSFGKIVSSKDLPSRILFVPYGKKGTIPENSEIISNITVGSDILTTISIQIISNLEEYYNMIIHYLNYNLNEDISNTNTMLEIKEVINLIKVWKDSLDTSWISIISLMDAIDVIRTETKRTNRASYINDYLSVEVDLYTDRFDVIDLRLSKVGGTLKELMTISKGTKIVIDVLQEQENSLDLYSKFFIVKRAKKDGEYYKRLFVSDSTNLSIGDTCYILSDNESVPEIEAEIEYITRGRLIDPVKTTYDEEGNADIFYINCKKVFFKNIYFGPKYLMSDNLRIIKEI